jgi:3-dehydroquinate synthetase
VEAFQILHNMPEIWNLLREATRRRTEVCIQAGGGHIGDLLQGSVKS